MKKSTVAAFIAVAAAGAVLASQIALAHGGDRRAPRNANYQNTIQERMNGFERKGYNGERKESPIRAMRFNRRGDFPMFDEMHEHMERMMQEENGGEQVNEMRGFGMMRMFRPEMDGMGWQR